MRGAMTFGMASVLAAALVHCAADGTNVGSSPDDPSDDASSEPRGDVSPDLPDSEPDEASSDAGICSPDGWCRTPLPTKDFDLRAVWSFGPGDALAVGLSGAAHWDGTWWSVVNAPDTPLEGLTSLWASGPNDVWAVAQGEQRLVHGFRAAPGAPFDWSPVEYAAGLPPFSVPSLSFIRGFGDNDLWILGGRRSGRDTAYVVLHGVLPSSGAGAPAWTTIAVVTPSSFSASAFDVTEGSELWVSGFSRSFGWPPSPDVGYVLRGSLGQGGDYVWEESMSTAGLPAMNIAALWAPRPSDVWAISNTRDYGQFNPTILNFHRGILADGGLGWTGVANGSNVDLFAAWGSGKDEVWAVGAGGGIRRWDGTRWRTSQVAVNGFPMYKDLFAIHGSSADDVWAVGTGVALHRGPGASSR